MDIFSEQYLEKGKIFFFRFLLRKGGNEIRNDHYRISLLFFEGEGFFRVRLIYRSIKGTLFDFFFG